MYVCMYYVLFWIYSMCFEKKKDYYFYLSLFRLHIFTLLILCIQIFSVCIFCFDHYFTFCLNK